MARQRAPGVYFERSDPSPQGAGEVRTDVAGFVGVADRGPLHAPVRVSSWTQFRTQFGGPTRSGHLPDAVRGFFANGGDTCWVVRVGVPPAVFARASLRLAAAGGLPVVRVWARDFGPATDAISVRVDRASGRRFNLRVKAGDGTTETWSDLTLDPKDPRDRYAPDVVNGRRAAGLRNPERPTPLADPLVELLEGRPEDVDLASAGVRGSVLVRLEDLTDGAGGVPVGVIEQTVRGPVVHRELAMGQGASPAVGVLGGLELRHFTGENAPTEALWGLKALEGADEVSVVAVPDLMWPGAPLRPEQAPPRLRCEHTAPETAPQRRFTIRPDNRPVLTTDERRTAQDAILRHCKNLRNRFAVLDLPWGTPPDDASKWAKSLMADAGQFGGVYYPWILVPDALSADGSGASPHVYLPPSGHVAGMFARVDRSAGVHKPPANERLEGVRGTEREIDPDGHGQLNDDAVNVIRAYPGRGVRVMGARTLAGPDDREWRFVHVRRLLLMIEESIERSSQWAVFEPNRPDVRRAIDRVVRNFLDAQWRAGRLDGASAEEAFTVVCDETTNPETEVDEGRLTCLIRVTPPQPAEVVVVRLGRAGGDPGLVQTGRVVSG